MVRLLLGAGLLLGLLAACQTVPEEAEPQPEPIEKIPAVDCPEFKKDTKPDGGIGGTGISTDGGIGGTGLKDPKCEDENAVQ